MHVQIWLILFRGSNLFDIPTADRGCQISRRACLNFQFQLTNLPMTKLIATLDIPGPRVTVTWSSVPLVLLAMQQLDLSTLGDT